MLQVCVSCNRWMVEYHGHGSNKCNVFNLGLIYSSSTKPCAFLPQNKTQKQTHDPK